MELCSPAAVLQRA